MIHDIEMSQASNIGSKLALKVSPAIMYSMFQTNRKGQTKSK